MRLKILLIITLLIFSKLHAQKSDSSSQFLIGLDVTGALGLKTNPGIRFQYEKNHLQLRAQIQYTYSEGSTPTDTITYTSKNHLFTPTAGAAWIASHDRFSFYLGSDFYYEFRKTQNNFPNPSNNKFKSRNFGFQPLAGFRFPLHKKFFMAIEGKSDGRIFSSENLTTGKKATNFNFSLLNNYGILLLYKF